MNISEEYPDIQKLASKLLTIVADDKALAEFIKDSPHYEEGNHEAPFFTEVFLYNVLGKDKAREVINTLEALLDRAGVNVDEARRAKSENEIFYDEEIAPVMRELCEKCHKRGMPFVAAVEYDSAMLGGYGSTTQAKQGMSMAMEIIYQAIYCRGNVDILFEKIIKLAGDNHTSVYLAILNDKKLSD